MNDTPRVFRVVSSTLIAQQDRSSILAALADFKTAGQARAKASGAGFAVHTVDPQGRVLVLKWKGIEVGLLFHREVSTIDVLPLEATPSMKVNTIEDEWMVINLVQAPYQDQVNSLSRRVSVLEDTLARTQAQLSAKTNEAEQAGYAASALQKQNDLLIEDNNNYKAAFQQHKSTGKGILVKYRTRPKEVDKDAKKKKKRK